MCVGAFFRLLKSSQLSYHLMKLPIHTLQNNPLLQRYISIRIIQSLEEERCQLGIFLLTYKIQYVLLFIFLSSEKEDFIQFFIFL